MLQVKSCLGVDRYWCLIPQLLVLIYRTTKGNCGGLIQNLCCRQLGYQVISHLTNVIKRWCTGTFWQADSFCGMLCDSLVPVNYTVLWWHKVQVCPSASLAIGSEFSCLLFNTLLHSLFQSLVVCCLVPCFTHCFSA